jgi:hypothetical protein
MDSMQSSPANGSQESLQSSKTTSKSGLLMETAQSTRATTEPSNTPKRGLVWPFPTVLLDYTTPIRVKPDISDLPESPF